MSKPKKCDFFSLSLRSPLAIFNVKAEEMRFLLFVVALASRYICII